ncbi:hypothetical protein N8I77_005748 [Diaporthe amygdali]|uniref:Rhodopsin domain-containing protein n=1 Tax=Phomopsis amygdali TaxID=1214568 RepID=A0AAD9SGB1_PHOAM|nr:hypothetical protein N8I77_005748 [Diaporthe amygdali]
MGNFDHDFDVTLRSQSWPLYSVGILLIIFRLIARARRLGVRDYQADDYLMLLVALLYTALIVCLNIIADGGGSNLYPPELEQTFTPKDIQERIYGSKIVVVSEQAMLNVIYTIKVCMLIMYTRLTLGLRDQRVVRYLAVYVFIGWLATEIAFFTACRPFEGYWGVPPPDPQCTTLEHYAIVQGCFNISSDMIMICIPMPLIVRMALPWRQKIVVAFIFSLGIFVILAALLTKIYNLTDVYDASYMLWYVREASVAVYMSNLPMIWPLLREWFPCLRALTPGAGRTYDRRVQKSALTSTARYGARKSTQRMNILSGKASGGTTVRSPSLDPVPGVHSKSPTYDVEMAIRGIDSDDDVKSSKYSGTDLEDQPGAGGWHDSSSIDQIVHIKTPPRSISRATTVDSNFRYLQMEQEARDRVMMGGIQVQTSFSVEEEVATPPQSSHGGPTPEPWTATKGGW